MKAVQIPDLKTIVQFIFILLLLDLFYLFIFTFSKKKTELLKSNPKTNALTSSKTILMKNIFSFLYVRKGIFSFLVTIPVFKLLNIF